MDNIWKQYDIRFTGIYISAEAIGVLFLRFLFHYLQDN